MTRYLPLILFPVLLFTSCGEPAAGTVDEVSAGTTPIHDTAAPLDVAKEPIMPQDQTEGTAEANPEVVDPARMPAPRLLEKAPAARQTPGNPVTQPASAPAAPAKPAPKRTPTSAVTPPPPPPPAPAAAPENEDVDEVVEVATATPWPDHGTFNSLLKTYVNGTGKVNYAGLKKDEAKLDGYLALLAQNAPDDTWSRNEALAYWLNAYNAFTLKLILKNYPVARITDLHGGKPWDVKWIELDGQTYSLNNLEHDIIRPRYQDPRIHFAVVCAATSCPPLANSAFTAGSLNAQLDRLARSFINNEKFNRTAGEVQVSKIFDWYAEDFGDVRAYLNKYLTTDIPAGVGIGYMEYDWTLNKQ